MTQTVILALGWTGLTTLYTLMQSDL